MFELDSVDRQTVNMRKVTWKIDYFWHNTLGWAELKLNNSQPVWGAIPVIALLFMRDYMLSITCTVICLVLHSLFTHCLLCKCVFVPVSIPWQNPLMVSSHYHGSLIENGQETSWDCTEMMQKFSHQLSHQIPFPKDTDTHLQYSTHTLNQEFLNRMSLRNK